MRDPLTGLMTHLELDGHVPLPWVLQYAPRGHLRDVWIGCDDAVTLMKAVAPDLPRRFVARAAGACAAAVLPLAGTAETIARAALDTLERAIEGHADAHEVAATRTALRTRLQTPEFRTLDSQTSFAARAAIVALTTALPEHGIDAAHAAGEPFGDDPHPPTGHRALVATAAASVLWATMALGCAGERRPRVDPAALLRARLPCPTLDGLRAAYRRG